jgi:prepilin-type N-terminal cleavage/methylation domain-containing protein
MCSRNRGLTLVEVIISALILAIVAGGMLHIFSIGKGMISVTGRRVQATDFASQTLEELKNEVNAEDWANDTGRLGSGIDIPDPLGSGELASFGGDRNYTVQNIDADGAGESVDYKSVTVTVDWTEP